MSLLLSSTAPGGPPGHSASAAPPLPEGGQAEQQRPPPDRYFPPEGFGGEHWGAPLRNFADFEPEPFLVQIAHSRGKVTELDMQCAPSAQGGCDLEKSLRTLDQRIEGKGFHLLAEYFRQARGFRFRTTGATVYPVLWQFCASWGGFVSAPPADVQQRMSLCGVRMFFQSERAEEVQALDPEALTVYDRVLRGLIDLHGEPEGYRRQGHVIIETEDGRIAPPRQRRFDEWRWCRVRGRDLAPGCTASIVLAFDPASGSGVVLYATRPVYEFAHARQHGGSPNDPLYKLLHGLTKYAPADHACTGSYLCRPDRPKLMSPERRDLFRLQPARPGGS